MSPSRVRRVVGADPRCTLEDHTLYSDGRTYRLAAITWLDPS